MQPSNALRSINLDNACISKESGPYLIQSKRESTQARLKLQSVTDDIFTKFVLPHVNVFYCLGGLTITSFLVQIALGFCLTFFYHPIIIEVYFLIVLLLNRLSIGWIIRSYHRWTANLMILCLVIYISRVYLTGGFKTPREVTWFTGTLLSVVTVSFGISGYSLPWYQIAFWTYL